MGTEKPTENISQSDPCTRFHTVSSCPTRVAKSNSNRETILKSPAKRVSRVNSLRKLIPALKKYQNSSDTIEWESHFQINSHDPGVWYFTHPLLKELPQRNEKGITCHLIGSYRDSIANRADHRHRCSSHSVISFSEANSLCKLCRKNPRKEKSQIVLKRCQSPKLLPTVDTADSHHNTIQAFNLERRDCKKQSSLNITLSGDTYLKASELEEAVQPRVTRYVELDPSPAFTSKKHPPCDGAQLPAASAGPQLVGSGQVLLDRQDIERDTRNITRKKLNRTFRSKLNALVLKLIFSESTLLNVKSSCSLAVMVKDAANMVNECQNNESGNKDLNAEVTQDKKASSLPQLMQTPGVDALENKETLPVMLFWQNQPSGELGEGEEKWSSSSDSTVKVECDSKASLKSDHHHVPTNHVSSLQRGKGGEDRLVVSAKDVALHRQNEVLRKTIRAMNQEQEKEMTRLSQMVTRLSEQYKDFLVLNSNLFNVIKEQNAMSATAEANLYTERTNVLRLRQDLNREVINRELAGADSGEDIETELENDLKRALQDYILETRGMKDKGKKKVITINLRIIGDVLLRIISHPSVSCLLLTLFTIGVLKSTAFLYNRLALPDSDLSGVMPPLVRTDFAGVIPPTSIKESVIDEYDD